MIRILFKIGLLGAAAYLMNQMRKPSRWLGRLFLKDMNRRHSKLTDWGIGHTQIGSQHAILDVGCGGGRTLEKLAALAPQANVTGVDYAAGSVAESRVRNAQLIVAGRVEVIRASVDLLPASDGQFDLVTAIETHYYWPDTVKGLSEIRRVLRPGGTLLLIAEGYRGGRFDWVVRIAMTPLRAKYLTPEEHRSKLEAAGFINVKVDTDESRGWICASGNAPG
jgi:SAM-dependent methyltransferase